MCMLKRMQGQEGARWGFVLMRWVESKSSAGWWGRPGM